MNNYKYQPKQEAINLLNAIPPALKRGRYAAVLAYVQTARAMVEQIPETTLE